jgi:hypothetical protein
MDTKNTAVVEAQLESACKAALDQIKVIKEKPITEGGAAGGELQIVETDIAGAELLAFRVPTSPEWKQYRIMLQNPDPASKVAAINNLVTICCVFPTRENFQRVVDAHPGLVETCYGDLQEHAGAGRSKKAYRL